MSKGPEIDAAAARKVADACSEFKLPKASEVSGAGPNSRDRRQRHGLPPAPAAAASVLITRSPSPVALTTGCTVSHCAG